MPQPLAVADIRSRSRGVVRQSYFLMTPDNMVENQLPHVADAVVKVLATPRVPTAAFGQYLVELSASGRTTAVVGADFENFLYLLDGSVTATVAGESHELRAGSFVFVPSGVGVEFAARAESRLLWLKKRYDEVAGVSRPTTIVSHVDDVPAIIDDLEGLRYKQLLPDTVDFDMAMNVMILDPGTVFPLVEIHHQEHGLYMLEGQGIYYLDEDHHEVLAEDYIYMAPYCPQYYYATGWSTSSYLLYKDVNRDGF